MKTRAAILMEQKAPLLIEEVTLPPLSFGQVLVRVFASGICGKQLDEYLGTREDPYLPHLLGHEGAGIVEEVGPGVTRVQPDDRVVASWLKGVGINAPTPSYEWKGREVNAGNITTFQERSIISENRLTKIPSKVPFDVAALFGCALPTGGGLIYNQAKVTPGTTLALFGLGGIGLCATLASRLVSPEKIIAVDIQKEKLNLAKKFGATHVINAQESDPVEIIKDLTKGSGVDFSIATIGKPRVMEQAYNCANKMSGHVILAGVPGQKVSLDAYPMNFGRKLTGSHGGGTNIDRDLPRYFNLYESGKLDIGQVITERFALDQINEAIEKLRNSKVIGRAIIEMKGNCE